MVGDASPPARSVYLRGCDWRGRRRCDEAAQRRLDALQGLEELETTSQAEDLATALLEEGPLPEKAAIDELHIAISAIEEIEYLLTWNCTHIANAAMRKPIEEVCRTKGVEAPIMCTPEELMAD